MYQSEMVRDTVVSIALSYIVYVFAHPCRQLSGCSTYILKIKRTHQHIGNISTVTQVMSWDIAYSFPVTADENVSIFMLTVLHALHLLHL